LNDFYSMRSDTGHSGGFEVGNSMDNDVVPVVRRSIATGEPVIVVTPNYRISGRCSPPDFMILCNMEYLSFRLPGRERSRFRWDH
jgi:hypothetical protein